MILNRSQKTHATKYISHFRAEISPIFPGSVFKAAESSINCAGKANRNSL